MEKVKTRLPKIWSPVKKKVFSSYSFLGEILIFLCNHFSTILTLLCDSNIVFISTSAFVSSHLDEYDF